MSNSIFDDDEGFSLSGGFDGEEKKKAPSAPVKKANEMPMRNAPQNPVRTDAPSRPQPSTTAPVKKLPTMPTKANVAAPKPATPSLPSQPRQTRRSELPPAVALTTNNLPTAPVYQKPEEVFEQYVEQELPPAPAPTHIEPEEVSYTDDAQNTIHKEAYNPPPVLNREEELRKQEAYEEEIRESERIREREREIKRARIRDAEIERDRKLDEERASLKEITEADLEDFEEAETPETVAKKGRPSRGRAPKAKSAKGSSKATPKGRPAKAGKAVDKAPGKYAGGRNKMLILRIVAFSLIGLFMLIGIKSTFFPTPGPTPNQVIQTAKRGMGFTDFPEGRGDGFVLAFSDVYLSLQEGGQQERTELLQPYMSPSILSVQQFTQTQNDQKQIITSGPFISGVRYVDDKNATYTVMAQVNDSNWIYMDVPVFYNSEEDAFAVSGTPAYVPAPEQATIDQKQREWGSEDLEVAELFKPALEIYFEAWGASDKTTFQPYITEDANTVAKTGLQGTAKFSKINSISIQPAAEATDPNLREARISIQWENALVPNTYYTQNYSMKIQKVADQWRIKELIGGIPAESVS